jgi:transitional endoplasmic reticulum ATPase
VTAVKAAPHRTGGWIGAQVERLAINSTSTAVPIPLGRAYMQLDPRLMGEHGLGPGAIVEVDTRRGHTALARLAPPAASDDGSGLIRLDRYLRQVLHARLGSELHVRPANVGPVRQLFLRPPLDLLGGHHLADHLRDELAATSAVISPNMAVYLPITNSAAGAIFQVSRVEDAPGIVTPETRVYLDEPDAGQTDWQLDVSLDDVGGLEQELNLVRELVQLPLQWPGVYRQLGIQLPHGLILYGPPGTGKTHLCRAMANELDVEFFYINGPEIVGTMHGETEATLRKLFGEAAHHAPSIICIDELDSVARARRDLGSQADVRAVTQLLSLMDGLRKVDGVVVIGTTNQIDVIDPAFRRAGRFDREIYIGPPDAAGRTQILQVHTREMPLDAAAQAFLPTLAERTHGFVGADLVELCRESGLTALRRAVSAGDASRDRVLSHAAHALITVSDLETARARVRPSAGRHSLVSTSFAAREDLAGLDVQFDWFDRLAAERFQSRSGERSESPVGGVLLYGPPGGGKSLLVHVLAGKYKPTFIVIHGPEIFSKWLGNTEEAVRHVFDLAQRMPPALIFIDQLEAIAPRRGSDAGSGTTDRVVAQLLTELDELFLRERVLVVGATNRPDLVDPGILRAGRLGVHLHVPLPGPTERQALLELFGRQIGSPLSEDNCAWLVERTEGLSGADLKLVLSLWQLQRDGGRTAGSGDTRGDLERALASVELASNISHS